MLRSTVVWYELVWTWRWISSPLADHLRAIGKRPPFASVEQKQSVSKRPNIGHSELQFLKPELTFRFW